MNYTYRIKYIFIIIILIELFSSLKSYAQLTRNKQIAQWIYLIPNYVQWKNYKNNKELTIGFLSDNDEIYNDLILSAKRTKINNKTVTINKFKRIKDISYTNILYIDPKYNEYLYSVYKKIDVINTLIITDNSESLEHSMINLTLVDKYNLFEVNSENINKSNLTISEILLARGGSRKDLQGLYNKKEAELEEKEKRLNSLEIELNKQKAKLDIKENELIEKNEENKLYEQKNKQQARELSLKQQLLAKETKKARLLLNEVTKQEELLKQNENILNNQKDEIIKNQEIISKANNEINEKVKELKKREEKIKNQEKAINVQSIQIEEQKIIIYGSIAFGLFFVFVGYIIYRGYRTNKRKNKLLEAKNEEIHKKNEELSAQKEKIEEINAHMRSSIRYALTIQQTILPLTTKINQHFKSFIIYKPKDIVSGDFYWFAPIISKSRQKKYYFIATIDCTGHGVPGAFMSLIANRLLNEIVAQKRIFSTKEILEELNRNVIDALKQNDTDNNDGMDVCLIRLEKLEDENYELMFTGAKRPLYIHQTNSTKIRTLSADRKSIGGVRAKRSKIVFTNQILTIEKNTKLYLTTDGMMDQNAPDRTRYGSSRFVALLNSICTKSLDEQAKIINNELLNFMDNQEQRDDITIFAVQLS